MRPPFDLRTDPTSRRVVTGLSKIGLALKTRSFQEAGERGLSPTQSQVLALLLSSSGRRLSSLCEEMGVKPATVSEAVATLVAKGLVRKGPAPEDRRAVALSLTAEGKRQAAASAGWPDFLVEAVDELSPAEQAAFLAGLVKMIRRLQEQGEIAVARMCLTCRFFRPNVHRSAERPHHCAFVDAPFGDAHLRVDCADHQREEAPLT